MPDERSTADSTGIEDKSDGRTKASERSLPESGEEGPDHSPISLMDQSGSWIYLLLSGLGILLVLLLLLT